MSADVEASTSAFDQANNPPALGDHIELRLSQTGQKPCRLIPVADKELLVTKSTIGLLILEDDLNSPFFDLQLLNGRIVTGEGEGSDPRTSWPLWRGQSRAFSSTMSGSW